MLRGPDDIRGSVPPGGAGRERESVPDRGWSRLFTKCRVFLTKWHAFLPNGTLCTKRHVLCQMARFIPKSRFFTPPKRWHLHKKHAVMVTLVVKKCLPGQYQAKESIFNCFNKRNPGFVALFLWISYSCRHFTTLMLRGPDDLRGSVPPGGAGRERESVPDWGRAEIRGELPESKAHRIATDFLRWNYVVEPFKSFKWITILN